MWLEMWRLDMYVHKIPKWLFDMASFPDLNKNFPAYAKNDLIDYIDYLMFKHKKNN